MRGKFGRFFQYAWNIWKVSLVVKWKQEGFWSLVSIIPSYIFIGYFVGVPEMSLELRIAVASFGGVFLTQILRFLWIALNAPFYIIRDQDKIIESANKKVDTDNIILSLRIQRKTGTEIRNEGSRLVHIDSVQTWKGKLEDWKEVTANIIASLDQEQAEKWRTLTNYTPKMQLPNPLSAQHNALYAQFSERLERLDKVTDYLKDRHKQ